MTAGSLFWSHRNHNQSLVSRFRPERLESRPMRILLVEDNDRLAAVTADALRAGGFTVDRVAEAGQAEDALAASRFEAVVLDLGLPDRDGMELLRDIRRRHACPVLILTARDGCNAIVDGLNAGADDYLLKPYRVEELVARLRALLRRPGTALDVVLRQSNVEVNSATRAVTVAGAELRLTRKEVGALELLVRRHGQVIAKSTIEAALYGFDDEVSDNAIEVLIHRLRKKLEGAGAGVDIHNLRGIGYLLSETPP